MKGPVPVETASAFIDEKIQEKGKSPPKPGERAASGPTSFIAGAGHISSHKDDWS
jgi:hypothetical protein